MFNRTNLFVVCAALAAGLGLWAAQKWFGPTPRTMAPPPATAPVAPPAIDAAALKAVRLFPAVRELPPFELQQSDGTTLTGDELRGHWTVVFLGFTNCPDVCPTTLADLGSVQKALADVPATSRPKVLFVSVDPERDTPAKTGEYAAFFHPDTLAATAPPAALQPFAASLGLVYMKVAGSDGNYSMDHSTALVVLDPAGRQAGLIRPPLVPADIAADLRRLAEAAR